MLEYLSYLKKKKKKRQPKHQVVTFSMEEMNRFMINLVNICYQKSYQKTFRNPYELSDDITKFALTFFYSNVCNHKQHDY